MDSNQAPQQNQEPAKRVRITTDPISQGEIDEVIEIYGRVIRNTLNTVKNMVKLGEKLSAIKARLSHGQWGRAFARAKFPFTIRTATRAMQTYHRFQADPALLDDPESSWRRFTATKRATLKTNQTWENQIGRTSEIITYHKNVMMTRMKMRVALGGCDLPAWTLTNGRGWNWSAI
jgi:hypothetical protein